MAVRARAEEQEAKLAETNKQIGQAFLEENKKKEGVQTRKVTLPGWRSTELQYKILAQGSGPLLGTNRFLKVKYRRPVHQRQRVLQLAKPRRSTRSIVIGHGVPGWREVLPLMKTGTKWELYLPSDLGYGDHGDPKQGVEPGATLVYEMELVGVEAAPAKSASPARPLFRLAQSRRTRRRALPGLLRQAGAGASGQHRGLPRTRLSSALAGWSGVFEGRFPGAARYALHLSS